MQQTGLEMRTRRTLNGAEMPKLSVHRVLHGLRSSLGRLNVNAWCNSF